MEMPECPVCLQIYDGDEIIPRVLSCGHTACESCIRQLPRRIPETIRCPACNQIVRYPQPQGPSALPKNIDLLRLFPQSSKPHLPKTNAPTIQIPTPNVSESDFYPRLWTEEFYSTWKDWILPSNALVMVDRLEEEPGTSSLYLGRIAYSSSSSYFLMNQNVGLMPVATYSSQLNEPTFNLSYTARVMEALFRMKVRGRTELGILLRASSRQRRLCKVFGLWMDLETGLVFLVCERFDGDFSKMLSESKDGVVCLPEEEKQNLGLNDEMFGFAMVGMELCEAVMGLHSEGIVSGCFAPSCFCFDSYGHFFVDLNSVIVTGRRVRKIMTGFRSCQTDESKTDMGFTNLLKAQAFVSPELFVLLHDKGIAQDSGLENLIGYESDIWSLGCILVRFLMGDSFTEELFKGFYCLLPMGTDENCDESLGLYTDWMEKVISVLKGLLGPQFESLVQILCQCLNYDMGSRPHVYDVWRCIRGLFLKPKVDIIGGAVSSTQENVVCCLILGDLCYLPKVTKSQRNNQNDLLMSGDILEGLSAMYLSERCGIDVGPVSCGGTEGDLIEGLHVGKFKSATLQGHLACITGLAIGGGFLFSSSFDRTVHVWSLQDFSHVQSLRGHEHRVMAVVVVDAEKPLCISGDSGGGIFVWEIGASVGKEPLKKWCEHHDWRYSGIHSLAVSGVEYLYSGSGDKSIKAWSLQDYTLTCTMHGHKAAVSSLVVCDGILYSGSWDGTVRLWWINDHSPLIILGDDGPGNVTSVLSLSVDRHMLVASHENGCVKMWKNDVLVKSIQTENGAIFAVDMVGKWLFLGGWNKIVSVQELSEDEFHVDTRPVGVFACGSVITALLYYKGKLFVGFSDKVIKVYCYEPLTPDI
ncbi:zinc ion binding protein [Tasmannia lanceolata]|uniref:zinc ion binding protein n=1 Tax=Tasmannia lanceolata TaxID=3420 RepID=UPI004062D4E2